LSAVASLQGELGFGLNGEHFVSGYSQGGHASMAMAKRMQEDPDAGFPLAGAAPMSGPYDMSGTQLPMGMAEEQYSNPAYLAYTLLAWQQT
jgi:poly(3-hydroxybutyrate) depolymerase